MKTTAPMLRRSLTIALSTLLTVSLLPGAAVAKTTKAPGKPTGVTITVNEKAQTATLSWTNRDKAATHRLGITIEDWPCLDPVVPGTLKAGVRSYTFGIKQMNHCPAGEWVVRVTAVKNKKKAVTTIRTEVTQDPWTPEPTPGNGGGGGGGYLPF
jgi:hypothetical protein